MFTVSSAAWNYWGYMFSLVFCIFQILYTISMYCFNKNCYNYSTQPDWVYQLCNCVLISLITRLFLDAFGSRARDSPSPLIFAWLICTNLSGITLGVTSAGSLSWHLTNPAPPRTKKGLLSWAPTAPHSAHSTVVAQLSVSPERLWTPRGWWRLENGCKHVKSQLQKNPVVSCFQVVEKCYSGDNFNFEN